MGDKTPLLNTPGSATPHALTGGERTQTQWWRKLQVGKSALHLQHLLTCTHCKPGHKGAKFKRLNM
ncbi:hypothetical protein E2C01_020621 [Portunus trituberculatus]|uniref:Uncharacterized protein n=1 Tax=Portunus trituberculatus TaxID=210409 RepID=A0A5B7E0D8_PORTR|nr:hypothetical protein [Portunus trituberculatus]